MATIWSKIKRFGRTSELKAPKSLKIPNVFEEDWYDWMLDGKDRRPFGLPTASDIPSIYEISKPFFEALEPSASLYVHGSFARGLETTRSDINLYIPSHSRGSIEQSWSQCSLRRPSFDDPSVGESIEVHLRYLLGIEVTLCCSDDPWSWVQEDVKVQVFPTLQDRLLRPQLKSTKREKLVQNIRKCWYIVSRYETDEAEKWHSWQDAPVDLSAATIMDANDESTRVKLYETVTAVEDVYYLLAAFRPREWRKEVPDLAGRGVVPLLLAFQKLSGRMHQAFRIEGDTSETFWEPAVHDFYRLALEIKAFKSALSSNPEL
jgi:hypothetical protein